MTFSIQLTEADVTVIGTDIELDSITVTVDWGIYIDARAYGIKGIHINVYNYAIDDAVDINYQPVEFPELRIEHDLEIIDNSVMITDCVIDLKNKEIYFE